MQQKQGDFRQRSITLPANIDDKLDILQSSVSSPKNKSALISKILKDFFENENYMKKTIDIDSESMLVPLQLYKDVEGISQMAVNSRIEKRKIKIEKIGNNDFVVVDKNSIKNIYLQNAQLQQTVKDYGLQLIAMHDKIEEVERLVMDIKNGEI